MSEPIDPIGILEGPAHLDYDSDVDEVEKTTASAFALKKDQAINARINRERQWEFYRLYLQGEVLARDRLTSEVYRVATDESTKHALAQDNILRPVARAFVGKLCRAIPTATVRPRSSDREDMLAAEVMDSFVDYFDLKESMRVKYKRLCEFLPWAGNALIQPVWDANKGRLIHRCEECGYESEYTPEESSMCPQCEVTGQASELEPIREGDVCARVIDPRNFFPDPGAEELSQMQWCFVRHMLPVAVVRQMFPDKANLISEEMGLVQDRSIVLSGTLVSGHTDTQYVSDHTYLYEYHEMPSGEYPYGRLIYFCGERILEDSDNIYVKLLDRLPFYPIYADRRSGEFWAEPPIEQAWSLQRERNKLMTQMREHRELTNNPKMISPQGNGVSQDYVDKTAGQIIKYRHMVGPPQYLPLPPFPSYAFDEAQRLRISIMEKFGVTEQEMGSSAGSPSGRYAAILEAQSTESINTMIIENVDNLMQFYKAVLILAQCYYSPQRRWAVSGQDRVKTYSWDRANIRAGWDVGVRDGDSMSRNPALRRQEALAFLQQGAFVDPATGQPDLKAFWRMAGINEIKAGYDDETNERTYGMTIPEMFARGKQIQPQPEDDSKIIAEELLGWLRGPGRAGADPRVVQQVRELWMQLTEVVQGGQAQQGGPEGEGEPGGGGGPGGGAPIPPDLAGGGGAVPQNDGAEAVIQQADQAAEYQANAMQQEN